MWAEPQTSGVSASVVEEDVALGGRKSLRSASAEQVLNFQMAGPVCRKTLVRQGQESRLKMKVEVGTSLFGI